MIVFKVVGKRTRRGSNITIYKTGYPIAERIINAKRLCKEHPDYFPKYSKGTIVKGVKATPGIMCFKQRQYAEQFLQTYLIQFEAKIIRVKGIGRPKYSFGVIYSCGDKPEFLFRGMKGRGSPISGTVAFKTVKVLD